MELTRDVLNVFPHGFRRCGMTTANLEIALKLLPNTYDNDQDSDGTIDHQTSHHGYNLHSAIKQPEYLMETETQERFSKGEGHDVTQ